jgi:hypothetical protein
LGEAVAAIEGFLWLCSGLCHEPRQFRGAM